MLHHLITSEPMPEVEPPTGIRITDNLISKPPLLVGILEMYTIRIIDLRYIRVQMQEMDLTIQTYTINCVQTKTVLLCRVLLTGALVQQDQPTTTDLHNQSTIMKEG